MGHALLSPSGASRWMACPGSVPLEQQCPDDSSEFADDGTASHLLASRVLMIPGARCSDYFGNRVLVDGDSASWVNTLPAEIPRGRVFLVDDERAMQVQKHVDYVRALGGQLMVEQRLPIEHLTGETGATGTSDAVVLLEPELVVVDLKYGMGVRVDAKDNPQLMMYALSALEEYSLLGDFQTVRMVIHQPRLDHVSEWVCSVGELQLFVATLQAAAARAGAAMTYFKRNDGALHPKYLQPGEEQCRFCRAKAVCPALAEKVLATVAGDFVDVTQPVPPQVADAVQRKYDNATLGNLLASVELVETWCKAVRSQAETELLAGQPVPGWKLVEGRRGARKWSNEAEAEAMLKSMRLKVEEMYDLTVISPTSAEKLTKTQVIGPRQWPKLQGLITQSDGKPSVAPQADKRPALVIQATADEFSDESGSLV